MNDILSSGLIEITDNEFQLISNLVYERFGINLTDKKKGLVKGRLNKLLRELGFTSFKKYYDFVIEDKTGQSLLTLVDKISTNHSFFFREKAHFHYLNEVVLPQIVEEQKHLKFKSLRIWSAGCAAGEEAYTVAIVLKEYFGLNLNDWDIGILATDISLSVLNQAISGKYQKEKVINVPGTLFLKYFKNIDNDFVEVNDDLKKMVLFKRLNFMNADFPFKSKFNIIFCRNVMIYFDKTTRESLVNKLYKYTFDKGYLFIGHSESLQRDGCPYKYIKPAVYYKV
jgi:chemotaxis protein methyltransferase CheR